MPEDFSFYNATWINHILGKILVCDLWIFDITNFGENSLKQVFHLKGNTNKMTNRLILTLVPSNKPFHLSIIISRFKRVCFLWVWSAKKAQTSLPAVIWLMLLKYPAYQCSFCLSSFVYFIIVRHDIGRGNIYPAQFIGTKRK